MMEIKIKSVFHVLTLSLLFGLLPSIVFGQQWGLVEKSNQTKQIGNQFYYLHTIAKGNTLYSLAKTYEVSIDDIRAANPELNKELKLGEVILIPVIDKVNTAKNNTLSYDNFFYHVVKQGETLNSISKIYGVNVADIVNANNLQQSNISTGFYLKIPEIDIKNNDFAQKTEPQDKKDTQSKYFEHIVQPKETLYSIAKRYGIGLETLKYINNFSGSSIYPGQKVLIPSVLKDWQSKESKNYIIHKVQAKEGLYGIARKYGVTIDQIFTLNPGINENLSIGQELKISRQSNEKGYIEHRVTDRKEKLADIADEYDVSLRNLKELNPDAPSKIRRGETVYIPVDFTDKPQEIIVVDLPKEEENIPIEPKHYTQNKRHVFDVALMLPLYLTEVDSMLSLQPQELAANKQNMNAFRFLEFYEGAQIAVDSLRALGMQVNFHVYDVTDNDKETALMLQDRALSKMDLIISLLFSRSFTLVSNFSRKNHIPLVNALSKRGQIVYENPYVFKISPKPEAMYNSIANFVGNKMSDYNIIIVRNNPYQLSNEYNLISSLLRDKVSPKAPLPNALVLQKINRYMEGKKETFLGTLKRELVKNDFSIGLDDIMNRPFDTTWVNNPIKTVVYSKDSLGGIMRNASLFRNNLIIALGSEEVFSIELFTKLNFVRDSLNIDVIGLPDWHNFMKLDVDYSQPFSLRVLSEDFVDYNSADVNRFIYKFQRAYHKVPEIDNYSFLGYDATFYFLHALFRYGDDMLQNISDFQIPLLQNQLKFEKQHVGGFENTYWNLYRQEDYQYKLEK